MRVSSLAALLDASFVLLIA